MDERTESNDTKERTTRKEENTNTLSLGEQAGRQSFCALLPPPPPPPPPPPSSPTSPPISTRVEIDGQSRPAKCNGYFGQPVRTCVCASECGRESPSATVSIACSDDAIDGQKWNTDARLDAHLRTLSIEGYSKQR